MQQINELSAILNQHFKWNKARIDCFCGMQIGLIKARSINLTRIATAFPSLVSPESRYRRLLNKKGNSNSRERIARLKRFIKQFGKDKLIAVLADREFIGATWFKWLKTEEIDFHIRVKKNTKVPNSRGEMVQVQLLFRLLKVGEQRIIRETRTVTDVAVYLSALRLEDGTRLIIASSKFIEQPLETYAKRWEIETLFSCLKERGFNLEDTRITQLSRLKRLLVVQ